jgi:hypothetical protein
MGDPRMQGLPVELQARLEVALTLGAQVAAIRHLVDALAQVLQHELPEFKEFAVALNYHVRALETYFKAAELDAWGVRALGLHPIPKEVRHDG